MINFYEWLFFKEVHASDDALMNYYKHIKQNPNLDDIRTLISMMKQTRDARTSEVIPLILKNLKKDIFSVPREEQEQAIEEINDAEHEILGRWHSPASELEKERKFSATPKIFKDPYEDGMEKLFGNKDDDFNWVQEVINYMKDNLDVDLEELDDDDPILDKAHNMIIDQHETGVLDTRTTAERVAKFIKDQLGLK
jgi:hypothetical protein